MLNKKSYLILFASLLITILVGCGGGSSNLDVSTSSSGAQLASISITPVNPTLAVNTSQQFTATGIYSDNTTQDLTSSVTWTSSASDIASGIDEAKFTGLASNSSPYYPGYITATHSGCAKIWGKLGTKSGWTTVCVTPATLVSLAITPANPSVASGTKEQFTATGTFSDNTTQDLTLSVTWSSSAAAVATISNAAGSNGLATSVAVGSTTITATSGNISGSTPFMVTPATLVSIAVTPTNPSIVKGTTRQFTATGTYSDSTTQNLTAAVTWSSSVAAVAAISNAAGSNGLATSVAAGSTTITATSGSISRSTTLTVTSATLVSITVTPINPSIAKGTTQQFTATGTYSDSSTQNLTTAVTWSSSAAAVATISNAAGSNGLATSVAVGSTTITATSGSIAGTATLTVTGSGVLTLTWDAPTTNTDGSALNPATDLSLYKIYYGTASQTYTQVVNVTNPGTTTVSTTLNLSPGTYYFVVTTVNTSGQESSYSNEAVKTI
jgi:trimeric autotransporter adhesin